MNRIVVVKLGGSLLTWPALPAWMATYLAERKTRGDRLVLLVGGGPAADLVRDLDRLHGLGEERSHALALHALDFTAQVVAGLLDGLVAASNLDDRHAVWASGRTPVLAPRRFLDDDDQHAPDPLPHAWSVTSDSIAARLATRLDADELVLLKSAPLPPGTDRREAAQLGVVDPVFPDASRALDRVTYLNLRQGSEALFL